MLRIEVCLASVVLLTCGLHADEKSPIPKGPSLSAGTASIEGEALRCAVTTLRYSAQIQTVEVMRDGKLVKTNRTVYVPEYVTQTRLIPLKGLRGYIANSQGIDPTKHPQRLDLTKLRQLLKNSPHVLFMSDRDKVSPEQVRKVKEGTVILILNPPPTG